MSSTIIRSDRIKCKLKTTKDGIVKVQVRVEDRTAFLDAVSKFIMYMSSFEMDPYIWCLDDNEKTMLSVDRTIDFLNIVNDIPYDVSCVSNEVYEEIKLARLEINSFLDRSHDCLYSYEFNFINDLHNVSAILVTLESCIKHKGFHHIPYTFIERLGLNYFSFIALDSFLLAKKALEYFDEWKWVR